MITPNGNSFLYEVVFLCIGVYLILLQVKADKGSTVVIILFSLKGDTKGARIFAKLILEVCRN